MTGISYLWFIYYDMGNNLKNYYWWTWFSALVAVYIAWAPVILGWALHFIGADFTTNLFLYTSLASISGPMVGYFVPIVILIIAFTESTEDTGLNYSSEVHFWLGWTLGIV